MGLLQALNCRLLNAKGWRCGTASMSRVLNFLCPELLGSCPQEAGMSNAFP